MLSTFLHNVDQLASQIPGYPISPTKSNKTGSKVQEKCDVDIKFPDIGTPSKQPSKTKEFKFE